MNAPNLLEDLAREFEQAADSLAIGQRLGVLEAAH